MGQGSGEELGALGRQVAQPIIFLLFFVSIFLAQEIQFVTFIVIFYMVIADCDKLRDILCACASGIVLLGP